MYQVYQVIGMGIAYLVIDIIKSPVSNFVNKFHQKHSPYFLLSEGLKRKRDLENLFNLKKPYLNKDHIHAIEETFRYWHVLNENAGDSAAKKQFARLKELLSLPMCSMPSIIIDNVEKKVNKLISTYSEELQIQMKNFIQQLIISTYEKGKVDKKLVNPTYFLGDPGVGKTRFATKILEILGIPYKLLLMPNAKNEQIIGSSRVEPWSSTYELGIIFEALRVSKHKNIVILLDEVDKALRKKDDFINGGQQQKEFLLSWLLYVLDSETVKTKCEVFNFEIDISRVSFVLIGNENI